MTAVPGAAAAAAGACGGPPAARLPPQHECVVGRSAPRVGERLVGSAEGLEGFGVPAFVRVGFERFLLVGGLQLLSGSAPGDT